MSASRAGIDAAHGVQDTVILEAARHQDEAVHLGQLVQQLTGDAAFGRTGLQPGDIRIGHLGIDRLLRLEHLREFGHARVRDIHHRGMDFEASGRGGGGRVAARQGVENGGLS